MQVYNNNTDKKHARILNALTILRIIFIPCIIVLLMLNFYGAPCPWLYRIPDFTQKFDDGYANYCIQTLYLLIAGILFLISCGLYILERVLVKKGFGNTKFHKFWCKILFYILVDATLLALAWHDFTLIIFPIMLMVCDIVRLNIKKHAIINNVHVRPNQWLNIADLFKIIAIAWILFIFNGNEYTDHIIMWWIVQNLFSYCMVTFAIAGISIYGKQYRKLTKVNNNGNTKN